ncbi:hypothetical protein AcW1_010043 [Taiwanofungus camphoratus]|nr:hypothetical protein AcV5_003127 [Antrodia cinnamomea]KAI0946621.1 hypothetical protein AcW1_010043 [Antrodia cinnamomea]
MTITAHWILGVYRLFQAFVNFQGGTHPLTFYSDMSNPTEVVQTGLLMVTLVIDDAMIIYRLWIIWCYNKLVVVFPLCTLVGLAVCGGGVTYQQSRLHPGEDIFMSAAGRWITSNCIFTLCTNLYSTSMIVWRVWCANAAIRKYGGGNLMGILAILVESAALYTAWTVFFFVSYESHSNLQLISSETYSAVAGIAFMLINVRVGMGWALKAHEQPIHVASGVMGSQHHGEPSFAMRPLAVNITRVVQREDDFDAFKKSSDSGSPGLASAPET